MSRAGIFVLCLAAAGGLEIGRRPLLCGAVAGVAAPGSAAARELQEGRGMRAVGTPNANLDVDAALGISWGGASRCDAADPACLNDGGEAAAVAAAAVPAARPLAAIATLRVSIGGRDEGVLRVGLYEDAPAAGAVFGGLAASTFTAGTGCTAASWVYGAYVRVDAPFVRLSAPPRVQEVAYRRRAGARKTPEDFSPATVARGAAADAAAPRAAVLPAGALAVDDAGPGPDLAFALVATETPANGRYAAGALLDAPSMALLARLANLPTVSKRAALGGKAGEPLVKVAIVDAALLPP